MHRDGRQKRIIYIKQVTHDITGLKNGSNE